MRIPPFHREKSWQRFFAGFFLGLIFGWLFFLFHFGTVHEKLVLTIGNQRGEIEKHERTIEILREDQDEINEENQKMLTVQDIRINFLNEDEVRLSELTLHELRGNVEGELENIRSRSIETVAASLDFIEKSVMNKTFIVNEKRYQLEIQHLVLYTTLEIHVMIVPAE